MVESLLDVRIYVDANKTYQVEAKASDNTIAQSPLIYPDSQFVERVIKLQRSFARSPATSRGTEPRHSSFGKCDWLSCR